MRDNQQYLVGERIDGAFNMISSYAGGVINGITGLFVPWVYKKKGFDGNDYSVLDVYVNYDETKPLSQQTKNPNCVLYSLMDTLLVISIIGAAIDVLPWLLYDISETGQKSMIRVIRIRTLVEDRDAETFDDVAYIEGCEAILKAQKYYGKKKKNIAVLKNKVKIAKKKGNAIKIAKAKKAVEDAKIFNEEVEIAAFVTHELNRFENEFGQKQLELCRKIVGLGPEHFYECADEAYALAIALPETTDKEERVWRKQEIRNAKTLLKSAKLAQKHYPDGIIPFDNEEYEAAYNMPDDTKEQARVRRQAMREASKKKSIYASVAAPYLAAKRTLDLYEGYMDFDDITADYDRISSERKLAMEAEMLESERLKEERRIDRESKKAAKRLKK